MKATKIFGSFVVGLLLKELLSCKFVFEIYVCLTSAVTLTLRTFTCSALCGYPVHNLTLTYFRVKDSLWTSEGEKISPLFIIREETF